MASTTDNNLKAGTRPQWVGLGASVWLQIASGNGYNFPLYSHSLKSDLGFNQRQITMLGVACDVGGSVSFLPGIACNRFPPWVVVFVGALACFIGYGVLWLSVSGTLQSVPFWLLWIALCVATNSSAWLSTAVLVTNMRNFPLSRGSVAGVLKGYSGLSAAVFTEIFSILLDSSSSKLLMFLALGIPIMCFVMMYFLRACTPVSGQDVTEQNHFAFVQVSSIVLGLYLLLTTILNHVFHFSTLVSITLLALMVILLLAPLAIPVKMTFYQVKRNHPVDDSDIAVPLLGRFRQDESWDVDEGVVEKRKRKPRRGEDFEFKEAIVKADFWLLFFVYFVGVGSGVTVLNNLAQIGIALGIHDMTVLLSLFSFCNFVGRLGGGFGSEHFVRTRSVPRTVWMTITQLIMIVAYLLYASSLSGTLYTATAILGICFGCQTSIMIPTASELFGLKHFGTFYSFMNLGSPLSAFLLSGLLAGYIYDKEASKQHVLRVSSTKVATCYGPNCFRLTFLVLAGMSCVGSMLSFVLTKRIRPVYETLYASGSFRLPQGYDQ